jgi:undecaprenyl-diphosphatase
MPLYQVIVLAIVQGLTEFLPISSTAHLKLVPWLFGWQDPGLAFDIALHAGTLAAVLIYFYKDWIQIIAQAFGARVRGDRELSKNPKLLWLLVIGSIPVGVAGLLFGKQAETTWRSPYVIATMLILVGLVMWIADRKTTGYRALGEVRGLDAITIGAAQALAVVPGTSRSGITITAALFRDFDRAAAARFSFLLSTPAIAAAAAKDAWDLHKHSHLPLEKGPLVVGVVVSGIVGAMVIGFFLKYLRRHSLTPFVWYRVIFGIIVFALAAFFRFNTE